MPALDGSNEPRQPSRADDSNEVEALKLHETTTFELRGRAAYAFERQTEEAGDVQRVIGN